MPMVTPLAAHAWPEFTVVSNWTRRLVTPPAKTSLAALLWVARVAIRQPPPTAAR